MTPDVLNVATKITTAIALIALIVIVIALRKRGRPLNASDQRTLIILAVLAVLSFAFTQVIEKPPRPPREIRFGGMVVDERGDPVVGARINLPAIQSTDSVSGGDFSMTIPE